MNEQDEPAQTPTTDSFEQIEVQIQPAMNINIYSVNNLELTITKTCLEVLNNLGKAFSNAMKTTEVRQIKASSPYLVQNDTGIPITLCLSSSAFLVQGAESSTEVIMESSAEVPLKLKPSEESKHSLHLKRSRSKIDLAEHVLHVKVEQANCELDLPVMRADKRFFLLNYRAFKKDNWGLVSAVKVEDGVKVITLRSIVQVCISFYIEKLLQLLFGRFTITSASLLKYFI